MKNTIKRLTSCERKLFLIISLICYFIYPGILKAQQNIELDSMKWMLKNGRFTEYDGRKCLTGTAELKDVGFKNGTIEADLWLENKRSYPGIYFRKQSDDSYEYIYLRPHRFGLYDDAIQYAPAFNGEVCWQLYFGEGYTSSFNTSAGKWVHLKLEVKGSTSQLFIDDMQKPVLITERLETGNTYGSIQITSGHPTMYLSNFKVEHANEPEIHIGQNLTMDSSHYINEWQISKNLPERNFNDENYPRFYDIFNAGWETAYSDGRALLNISKYRQIVKDSNCVYAKAIISSEKGKRIKLAFGYSDAVKIYLNKKLIYSGNYAYQSRGNSFTGVIGLNDTLYLDLKKGLNELFIKSSETFGGWGLRFEADQPLQALKIDHPSVTTIGQSKVSNLSPESILHDPKENVIYVTHFDNQFTKHNERKGFISKLSGSGRMLDSLWITGLKAPTGICRRGDKMYVVDREELVEISIKKQKVTAKYKYPENIVFANDVITDPEGNVYITNSDGADKVTDILILEKGKILPWINTIQLQNLNGIFYHDGKLLVGNGEDSTLKSVDVVTREVSTITSLGTGIVDGIQVDGNNNYLVSVWEGGLYKISPAGEIIQLIDSTGEYNIADFGYDKTSQSIFIPTFLDQSIRTFQIK